MNVKVTFHETTDNSSWWLLPFKHTEVVHVKSGGKVCQLVLQIFELPFLFICSFFL